MVKIQVDLDEKEDQIVDIFRAEQRLKSKSGDIKEIIQRYQHLKSGGKK